MSIGGKYAGLRREPGSADAGTRRESRASTAGIKREFKGSGIKSYTYTRVINGIKRTQTIRAHSVSEANTLAASQGFKTSDREVKRRKKRKK